MNIVIPKFLLPALLIFASTIEAACAEQILIDDAEQTVTLTRQLNCDRPAHITIDTSSPEIYGPGSQRLQSIVDAARAILRYECPRISRILVNGLVRGLDENIYQGELAKQNNWVISNNNTVISDSRLYGQPDDSSTTPLQTIHDDGRMMIQSISVTNLQLGMTVDEAMESIRETFDEKPQYNEKDGLLSLQSSGCPDIQGEKDEDYDLQPPMKCLNAWFTDKRTARLDRLELTQIVDGDIQQVESLFVQKYGHPNRAGISPDQKKKQLVWLATNNGTNPVIQQLTADLSVSDEGAVITQTRLSRQKEGESVVEIYPPLDLKL